MSRKKGDGAATVTKKAASAAKNPVPEAKKGAKSAKNDGVVVAGAAPLKRAARLLLVYVTLIALFLGLMTAVYALPQGSLLTNLQESLAVFQQEGPYTQALVKAEAYTLDNYTDSIMLDTTYKNPSDSPLTAAVACYKSEVGGNPLAGLAQTAQGGDRPTPNPYAYYWSGYIVFLRPALMVLNYGQWRTANMIVMFLLVGVVLYQLWKVGGVRSSVALLIALLAGSLLIIPRSIQFSNMTYLMLWSTLVVLLGVRKKWYTRFDWEIFFVTGMLAAFFDLLTFPIVTLGVPLAVALIARSQSQRLSGLKAQLVYAVSQSALWSAGYLASWFVKPFIAQAVLRWDVPALAYKQLLFRIGGADGGITRPAAVWRVFSRLFWFQPVGPDGNMVVTGGLVALFAVLLLLAAAFFIVRRSDSELVRSMAVLFVVPLPYIWYVLAAEHSAMHAFFTFRAQMVAIFAVLYFLFTIPDPKRLRGYLNLP